MQRTKSHLHVVSTIPQGHSKPPGPLDQFGLDLWMLVTSQYEFDDPGSIETLYQACACRQRAEHCRERIDKDGQMIRGSGAILRSHPLLRDEIANRALCARLIQKLGLNLEPLHDRPGRRSGN